MCQKKIMRKRSHDSFIDEPPRKRISRGGNVLPKKIIPGEVLTDLTGKQWRVGKVIGHGGFGEIYLASDNISNYVKNDAPYVVKIESHSNGPLFVEINCFLRIARKEIIDEWKEEHKRYNLGMPHYIASGSHKIDNEKLRFLVLPRYDQDLEKILAKRNKKFNLKTVIEICTQILDILEYIHSKGYVHCDIKASNILHSIPNIAAPVVQSSQKPYRYKCCNPYRACRSQKKNHARQPYSKNLRPEKKINYNESDDDIIIVIPDTPVTYITNNEVNTNGQVYLLDYGLASKYRLSNGQHKQYCNDERKAHAGTILFCSLDAHLGAQSRRSDLESLGYNMIYWLTSKLPWNDCVESPETVQMEKKKYFQDLDTFLKYCFGEYPRFIYEYFKYVKTLNFESKPDYVFCKKLLQGALLDYGYKENGFLDFDNLEGWGCKQKIYINTSENFSKPVFHQSGRIPLTSNIIVKKPMLRQRKAKKSVMKKLHWSKILADPEVILRRNNKTLKNPEVLNKPRDRKIMDASDNSLQILNICKLNPTYAMLEVLKKLRDRNGNYNNAPFKNGRGDSFISEINEGYTPAMNLVLAKMQQRKLNEIQANEECTILNSKKLSRTVKTSMKKSGIELRRTRSSPNLVKDFRSKSTRILRRYGLRG